MSAPWTPTVPKRFTFLTPTTVEGDLGTFGNYRIVRLIGTGGMAFVFEGEDQTLHRPVAVKVLRPEVAADPDQCERFLREARVTAALPAEAAVTVYEIGQANGTAFMVMELLAGESLQTYLDRVERVSAAFVPRLGRQVAATLAVAHQLGVIHRDIKPANIWLEADRATGLFRRVRVLDFGLARAIEHNPSLTATGVVMGTPQFMAPEQVDSGTLDARTDLFSLGSTLYRAAAGRLPFDGTTTLQLLTALTGGEPTPLTETAPDLSPGVAALIHRLLAKDPADRPRTAAEVVAVFDRELAALPAAPNEKLVLLPGGTHPATPRKGLMGLSTKRSLGAVTPTFSDSGSVSSTGRSSGAVSASVPAPAPTPRRPWRMAAAGGGLALLVGLTAAVVLFLDRRPTAPEPAVAVGEPISVGILHSQSGAMKESEEPVIDATLLAIDEVNRAGGVLGRQLKPVVVDGKSSEAEFTRGARELIERKKVAVIFGCWTSASRKGVKEVVEREDGLLFYPLQFEGLEQSPRIVYTGAAPNQQLLPAVEFLTGKLGKKRLYLIGSDYVYPRAANAIMSDVIEKRDGVDVVGEGYVPLGASGEAVEKAVAALVAAKPDAILNSINGSTNVDFFRALRAAGVDPAVCPTLSVAISENELKTFEPGTTTGGYLVGDYFQSVDRPENGAFIAAFRARYGRDRVTSGAMVSAYSGVKLWAKAATAAKSVNPNAVLLTIGGMTYDGPGATVTVDADTHLTWRPVRVGRIRADGQIDILPGSDKATRPRPYPDSRTPAEWDRFLTDLHREWGYRWEAPGKK